MKISKVLPFECSDKVCEFYTASMTYTLNILLTFLMVNRVKMI